MGTIAVVQRQFFPKARQNREAAGLLAGVTGRRKGAAHPEGPADLAHPGLLLRGEATLPVGRDGATEPGVLESAGRFWSGWY